MNVQWKVRIDIPRLQANLSQANEWPFTPDSTFRWLAFMGFRQLGGVWHTDGPRLNRLQPDEILEKLEVGELEPDEMPEESQVGVHELETVGI